jgi:hypothetical protein
MNTRRWFSLALGAFLPLVAACSARHTDIAHANPNHLNPAQAQQIVQEPKTGHTVDTTGTIPQDQTGKKFTAGEPVYVAFKVGNAPLGSKVRIDWYDPNNVKIGTQAKQVTQPQTTMNFAAINTAQWNPGTYHLEIWIADQRADTEEFSVSKPDTSTDNG